MKLKTIGFAVKFVFASILLRKGQFELVFDLIDLY